MAEKATNVKAIPQFPGYGTNRDPHDSPEIAIDATNVTFHEPGKMPCRKGSKPITFTNALTTDDTEYDIIAAFPYKRAGTLYIVHEDSNGSIRIGRIG